MTDPDWDRLLPEPNIEDCYPDCPRQIDPEVACACDEITNKIRQDYADTRAAMRLDA